MSGAHWPRARARAHELENLQARAGARAGARTPVFQGERERERNNF